MFSMMVDVWRLTAVSRSRRPRTSSGTMIDIAGISTVCTKVVPASLCTTSFVSPGLTMQLTTSASTGSMSRLPTTVVASVMHVIAACLTCFFVSPMHSETIGTSSSMMPASELRASGI